VRRTRLRKISTQEGSLRLRREGPQAMRARSIRRGPGATLQQRCRRAAGPALCADDQAILALCGESCGRRKTINPGRTPRPTPNPPQLRQEGCQMNNQAVLTALLRSNLRFFIWRASRHLPGTLTCRLAYRAIVYTDCGCKRATSRGFLINPAPRSLIDLVSVAMSPGCSARSTPRSSS